MGIIYDTPCGKFSVEQSPGRAGSIFTVWGDWTRRDTLPHGSHHDRADAIAQTKRLAKQRATDCPAV